MEALWCVCLWSSEIIHVAVSMGTIGSHMTRNTVPCFFDIPHLKNYNDVFIFARYQSVIAHQYVFLIEFVLFFLYWFSQYRCIYALHHLIKECVT